MEKPTYITEDGLKKLEAELVYLKSDKRKEIAARIAEAKEHGDLSENAEYTEAKEEQAFNDGRVLELEEVMRNVKVIKTNNGGDVVALGATFTAESGDGKKLSYTIVGSNESDPTAGRISNESPLGQSFLGKKVGESVEVHVPAGAITFKIVSID